MTSVINAVSYSSSLLSQKCQSLSLTSEHKSDCFSQKTKEYSQLHFIVPTGIEQFASCLVNNALRKIFCSLQSWKEVDSESKNWF